MRRFACVLWSAGLMALAADTAVAQPMESKFEIFGGYSYLNSESFGGPVLDFSPTDSFGRTGNHGFDVRFTYNLTSALGIEADVASYRRDSVPYNLTAVEATGVQAFTTTQTSTATLEQKSFSLLFGPRLSHRSGAIRVYAHLLVGLVNAEENASGTDTFLVPAGAFGANNPNLATTLTDTGTSTIEGSAFGFAAGGGVDWNMGGGWDIRIIEVDYMKVSGSGDITAAFPQSTCTPTNSNFCGAPTAVPTDTITGTVTGVLNNLRVSVGVVFRLGKS